MKKIKFLSYFARAVFVAALIGLSSTLLIGGEYFPPQAVNYKTHVVAISTFSSTGAFLGGGTGFVINHDGCVLTAAHVVISLSREIRVDLPGVISYKEYDIASKRISQLDLIVICPKVISTKFHGLPISHRTVSKDSAILIYGLYIKHSAFEERLGVVTDYISLTMREWEYRNAMRIYTPGPIMAGYSGSPILQRGQVVGLLAGCFNGPEPDNAHFCIAVNSQEIARYLHINKIEHIDG